MSLQQIDASARSPQSGPWSTVAGTPAAQRSPRRDRYSEGWIHSSCSTRGWTRRAR
jgi:hypothetical protein